MSFLDQLKARVDEAVEHDTIELDVPVVDVVLVCRALTEGELDRLGANTKTPKLADNALPIASACIGIYQRLDDGTLQSIAGEGTDAPTFCDEVMFAAFELSPATAKPTDVVRALYAPKPLAMPGHAAKVLRHSGLAGNAAIESLTGE